MEALTDGYVSTPSPCCLSFNQFPSYLAILGTQTVLPLNYEHFGNRSGHDQGCIEPRVFGKSQHFRAECYYSVLKHNSAPRFEILLNFAKHKQHSIVCWTWTKHCKIYFVSRGLTTFCWISNTGADVEKIQKECRILQQYSCRDRKGRRKGHSLQTSDLIKPNTSLKKRRAEHSFFPQPNRVEYFVLG